MKGKLKLDRPDYGPDVTVPVMVLRSRSRSLYVTTKKHKLRPRHWLTRLLVRIFPWWPWGTSVEIEAIREDRIVPR